LLDELTTIDLNAESVLTRASGPTEFDLLVLAPGHDDWQRAAPGLKALDGAVEIRRRLLLAFEAPEREPDPLIERRHVSFVVIGGRPTGVELAGAIAELATFVAPRR